VKTTVGVKFAMGKIAERARLLLGVVSIALLAGCATGPNANPRDPWEPYNRDMTKFNEAVDGAILKPAATAYKTVTPGVVRTGISNFFGNLTQPWTALNGALQLKGEVAAVSFLRFSVNFFFGFGGVLDLASEIHLDRYQEDFGQTLGRWGVPTGPYFVLPIYGPSTLRDAMAFGVESQADPVGQVNDGPVREGLYVVRALEVRANLLRAGDVLNEAALDKYTFSRDIFLQRRESQVFDGLAPEPRDEPVEQ
jgi:phospholipid-binding lipoprotein MlaA